MSTQKKSKFMYLAAFLLIFSGVGYLVVTSVTQSSTYFLEVSEALAMDQDKLDRARLFGKVAEEELERDSDALGVTFMLQDKDDQDKVIRVRYAGAVPDAFRPGAGVIVEGQARPQEGIFMAHDLMTQCPSRYESKQ